MGDPDRLPMWNSDRLSTVSFFADEFLSCLLFLVITFSKLGTTGVFSNHRYPLCFGFRSNMTYGKGKIIVSPTFILLFPPLICLL